MNEYIKWFSVVMNALVKFMREQQLTQQLYTSGLKSKMGKTQSGVGWLVGVRKK